MANNIGGLRLAVSASDIVAVAGALAWPVLLGLLLVVYRKDIREFARKIAPAIQGVTLGPVSFQFATANGEEPFLGSQTIDLRNSPLAAAQVLSSSAGSELAGLLVGIGPPLDYAVFNLGQGDKWITSRLYLFAVILQRMRSLKRIVFVERTQDGVRRHFVGMADPNKIAWALAHSYPWMEAAFASATVSAMGLYNNASALDDPVNSSSVIQNLIQNLIQNYITNLECIWPTNLSQPANAGDYLIYTYIQSAASLQVGQTIQVGLGQDSEIIQVSGTNIQFGSVNLQTPLQKAHAAGEPLALYPQPTFEEDEWREWVVITKSDALVTLEHAKWVDPDRLNRLLERNSEKLDTSAIRKNELLSKDKETQERMMLFQTGGFVALVNDDGVLDMVVDRTKLIEGFVR